MTTSTRQLSAVLFAVVLVVSAAAPAMGTTSPTTDVGGQLASDTVQPSETVQPADRRSQQASSAGTASSTSSSSSLTDGASADDVVADALRDADGEVTAVVRFEPVDAGGPGVGTTAAVQSLRAASEAAQEPVTAWAASTQGANVLEQFWLANAVLLEIDTDRVDLDALAAIEGVRSVHPNFEVTVPEPRKETAAQNAGEYNTTYGLDQVNATEVWDEYGTMGGGAKVAVLDTGVSVDHPDIDLYTEDPSDPTYPGGWAEFDVDGDRVEDSEPHDTSFHGTHTSGTVAGGNASGEYIGVAPNASLMHGLVLPDGSGSFAQLVAGMEWAVEEDADAISMSLSAAGFHAQMIEPVRNARDAGVAIVAAIGNDGPGTSGSPGNVYEAFAVGASNQDHSIASFSGGTVVDTDADWQFSAPADWPNTYVLPDVAAPGVDVKSAVPEGYFEDNPDAKYGYASGTSMATPHVAGVYALAVSAAERRGVDASATDVLDAVAGAAWKPAGAPSSKDTRYGSGIVDADTATDRIAAAQGVVGTITDDAGAALSDVTVELPDGYETTTNATGQYRIRGDPGTYTVTADAFGYEAATATANVTEGAFVERDLTLSRTVETRVDDPLPEAVRQGAVASVTLTAANAEAISVDVTGDLGASNLTLFVDGEEVAFGETVSLGSPETRTVTVTVQAAGDVTGEFSLVHTVTGLGDTATVTTGPTEVFGEVLDVAAVRSTAQGITWGDELHADLEAALPANYDVTVVNDTAVDDVVGDYDVFVVQRFGGNASRVRAIMDDLRGPETGVVLLDNVGSRTANAVTEVSQATGDPESTDGEGLFVFAGDDTVYYDVVRDHPIFEGVADAGESVPLYGSFYQVSSWFSGYSGTTVADLRNYNGVRGGGVGVDALTRTVLLSSLGYTYSANPTLRTDAADEVLANAVEYASAVPPVRIRDGQSAQVAEGEAIQVSAEVIDLTRYEVSLAEESTLTTDDLTLYVNGKIAAFNTTRAWDGVTSGNFTVTVVPEEGAVGTVALDHEFVAGESESISGTTGPTAVYDPPLEVPEDVPTVQAAADLVPPGGTIVVGEGTYNESVVLNASAVTLRGELGSQPTLAPPANHTDGSVLTVRGRNVEVTNLHVDGGGDNVGVHVADADAVDVRDVSVTNATIGVRSAGGSATQVVDSRVRDAGVGIRLEHGLTQPHGHEVIDNDVRNVTTGVRVLDTRYVTVRNNTVVNATGSGENAGIGIDLRTRDITGSPNVIVARSVNDTVRDARVGIRLTSNNILVDGSDVHGADTGVEVERYSEPHVYNATITDADLGFEYWDISGGELRNTTVEADTAVAYEIHEEYPLIGGGTPPATVGALDARFNHFDADVAFEHANETAAVDGRLNYYGPRGVAPDETVGAAVTDPFLTAPPSAIDGPLATMSETSRIGVDATLPANGTYTVGVPGPSDQTVADVFGNFTGAVYAWDAGAQSWELATGAHELSALDALAVVAEEDARAVLHFQSDGPSTPGQTTVQEGWNYVAAPASAPADVAFEHSTADLGLALGMFESPGSQLGPASELDGTYAFGSGDAPTVSPFEGAFVFAEDDGTLPAYLYANPTMQDLYEELDVAAPFSDEGANASTPDRLSVVETAAFEAALDAAAATDDREEVVDAALDAALDAADHVPGSVGDRAIYEVVREAVDRAVDTASNDGAANDGTANVDAAAVSAPPRALG